MIILEDFSPIRWFVFILKIKGVFIAFFFIILK